jgi:hypothetical protein
MRKRRRLLVTEEGWLFTQEEPYEQAERDVYLRVGLRQIRFVHEETVAEEDGTETLIYREVPEGEKDDV